MMSVTSAYETLLVQRTHHIDQEQDTKANMRAEEQKQQQHYEAVKSMNKVIEGPLGTIINVYA